MKPEQFIELAKVLAPGQTEVEWRSAISRAYYGLFHVARLGLGSLGFQAPRSEGTHRYVNLRLSNAQYPPVVAVGHALDELRGHRNDADYDLRREIEANAAIDDVNDAHAQVVSLPKAAQEATIQTMITEVIRAYERDILKDPTWRPPTL